MIAVIWNDLNDGGWLFGVLGWGRLLCVARSRACSPLTPALSRPAGEGMRLWRSMWQGLLYSGWAFRPLKRPRSRE